MGTTTFSGPIKAGTIKNTTGTTLGTDVANVGQVVMSQTFAADLSGGALAASVTDVVFLQILRSLTAYLTLLQRQVELQT